MPDPASVHHPRISRETRRLLATALLAVATLWVLARIRFPERPATPNPVPPLLTQLATAPNFEELALQVLDVQGRLRPILLTVTLAPTSTEGDAPDTDPVAALRIRPDVAIAALSANIGYRELPENLISVDRASGVALARVAADGQSTPPVPFGSQRPEQPQYLMGTVVSQESVSLKPVFVGTLRKVVSPAWPVPIWKVPPGTDVTAGSFLFTSESELAGLVVVEEGELAVVPGETVLEYAERLLEHPIRARGYVGVEVQSLSPALETVVAASDGVIVTWVDAEGPATKELLVGDILEMAQGQRIASERQWDVFAARLQPTDAVTIRVRRRNSVRDVQLIATSLPTVSPAAKLGLTLRRVPGSGVEVMRVDRMSAAERAGLQAGDLITLIGDRRALTPGQVTQAFAALPAGRPLLVAVTRGVAHRMLALER